MTFELGINNCFAVKRWPQPDEWARLIVEELGLSVVQHSLDLSAICGSWGSEVDPIRRACSANGIRIDSVFTGLSAYSSNLMLAPVAADRERGSQFWEAGIRFASDLGAQAFGGHVGSLSRADADDPERRRARWDELRRRLNRLARLARQQKLRSLLVENMACDREPWQMGQVGDLLSPAGHERAAIRLCLDVGHPCAPRASGQEADPYAWLRQMGARTDVVHLQQSDAHADHHWPFTAEFNARGRVRAQRIIESLLESGLREATLILEVIPPFEADDAQVLQHLRETVVYWKQALDEWAPAVEGA